MSSLEGVYEIKASIFIQFAENRRINHKNLWSNFSKFLDIVWIDSFVLADCRKTVIVIQSYKSTPYTRAPAVIRFIKCGEIINALVLLLRWIWKITVVCTAWCRGEHWHVVLKKLNRVQSKRENRDKLDKPHRFWCSTSDRSSCFLSWLSLDHRAWRKMLHRFENLPWRILNRHSKYSSSLPVDASAHCKVRVFFHRFVGRKLKVMLSAHESKNAFMTYLPLIEFDLLNKKNILARVWINLLQSPSVL